MPDTRRTISIEEFRWAYARLSAVTPLQTDCGALCAKSCCKGLDERAGMYLFPGEEALISQEWDWLTLEWHLVPERDFCPSWEGRIGKVGFVICRGVCEREQRPLACRLFPLVAEPLLLPEPVLFPESPAASCTKVSVDVALDSDAALMCPIARYAHIDQLDARFVEACREVYTLLAQDPLVLDDFIWQSERRRRDARAPWRGLLR
jgi:hypothetical protein